ncbi:hypothetical protein KAU11_09885 [Candidatus Babeliales bacterium]|nr:hypothetical protein [Candidatus Babeliales bacterium]
MKYKNISTKGSHSIKLGGKIIKKPGKEKHLKMDGVFKVVLPGETIDCPVQLNDPEMELIFEDKPVLSKMTKDQLNDYAANIGLNDVKSSMKRDKMIEMILEYQNAEE